MPAATVRRRTALLLLLLAALVSLPAAIEPLRAPVLRMVGQALVVNEPLRPADVIVISYPTSAVGVFEAADLVAEGIAPTVALFEESSDSVQGEFARRGIQYPSGVDTAIHQLELLGVESVVRIPFVVEGTEDQGAALREWFAGRNFHTVVLVTVPDHSRRLRRVLNRTLDERSPHVIVRVSRHSDLDPDRWWHTRDGLRTVIVEFQKLLLDVALHPLT